MRAPPRYASGLVGRGPERATLGRSLRPGALALVVGPGGVGKTRLVSDVVRGSGQRAVFVDLAAARDVDGAALALIRAVGATLARAEGEDVVAHAGRALAAADVQVAILDNLEQLGDAAGPPILAWAAAAPGVALVATSRAAVGVGEEVLTLEPLPVDGDAEDAVQLFFRALPRLGPTPLDPDEDRERVRAIVRRLGGLPLAIELCAGRAAVLPIDALERGLDEPLALLRDPGRAEDRTSTLWRSVAWSWDLLTPATAAVLAGATVFAGPFDYDAARAVLTADGDVADHLQVLVARHLVRSDSSGRFVLYESVRAFAEATAPPDEALRERHAAHFARRAEGYRSRAPEWEDLLQQVADLERVVARGLEDGASDLAVAHAREAEDGLYRYHSTVRAPEEHLDLLDRVLAKGGEDFAALRLYGARGRILDLLRRVDPAETNYREMDAVAGRLGVTAARALATGALARLANFRGEPERSEPLLAEAMALADAAAERSLLAILPATANYHLLAEGRFDLAEERMARSEALAREVGPGTLGTVLRRKALLEATRGRWEDARAALAESRRHLAGGGLEARYRLDEQARVEGLVAAATADRPSEAVSACVAELGDAACPHTRAWLAALLAVSAAIEEHAGAGALVAAASRLASEQPILVERVALQVLVASAETLLGAPCAVPVPTPDPASRTLVATLEALRDVVAGARSPDAPRPSGTPSAAGQVVQRALEVAEARARARARTWAVTADGSTFRPPGGAPVDLARRRNLAGLVQALARDAADAGGGLDADALFAAGWPGERAVPQARANRVRVAVTTLRKLGLVVLAWERDRGWFLDAPVALVEAAPGQW